MVVGYGIKHFLIQESRALTSDFEFVSIEWWILSFTGASRVIRVANGLRRIDASGAVASEWRNYTQWHKPSNLP